MKTRKTIMTAAFMSLALLTIPHSAYAADYRELGSEVISDTYGEDYTISTEEINTVLQNEEEYEKFSSYIEQGNEVSINASITNQTEENEMHENLSDKDNLKVVYEGIEKDENNSINKVYKITESPTHLKKGIDISSWQEEIDWETVSQNVDYAIIRVMDAICVDANGNFIIDEYFIRNMNECKKYNIPVGVYWFSRALTKEEAEIEAKFVSSLLRKYQLDYPVYIDVECAEQLSLSKDQLREVIISANNIVKLYGYTPGIYINRSNRDIVDDLEYPLWLTSSCTYNDNVDFDVFSKDEFEIAYDTEGNVKSYQYSSSGHVPGIDGRVDIDYSEASLSQEIRKKR